MGNRILRLEIEFQHLQLKPFDHEHLTFNNEHPQAKIAIALMASRSHLKIKWNYLKIAVWDFHPRLILILREIL